MATNIVRGGERDRRRDLIPGERSADALWAMLPTNCAFARAEPRASMVCVYALVFVSTACVRSAPGAPSTELDLDGVWGGSRTFAPSTPLDVEVRYDRERWSVRVGDRAAELARTGNALAAKLDEAGTEIRFRTFGPSEVEMDGHLIQPPNRTLYSTYATPVSLTRRSAGRWTGRVRPVPDRVDLYLRIQGETAFIREPGTNFGRRVGTMKVTRDGRALDFSSERGSGFRANVDPRSDSLTVDLEAYGEPLVLRRRGRDDAPGFYPGATARSVYRYAPPDAKDDGWPVASLAEVGLREAPIVELVQSILDAEPTAWTSPYAHSLLVARDGKLALEEYFFGHDADTPHDTRSAGKSFATTLIGIAVRQGKLGVKDRVFEGASDRRRAALRLEHLLSMSSGLDCDDGDDSTPGNEDVMQSQRSEPDWYRYTRALELVRDPGAKGVYCTAGINLLGASLKKATGEWIPDFFARELATPLMMRGYHFNLMPTGDAYLGGGIRLRPRDFAKLGQLFLSGGTFCGHRIVTEDWVAAATSAQASLHEADDYGYGWWRITYEVGAKAVKAYYASGNGGQLVIVVPSRRLVVAINGGNYGNFGTWRTFRDEWVPSYILRAASPG